MLICDDIHHWYYKLIIRKLIVVDIMIKSETIQHLWAYSKPSTYVVGTSIYSMPWDYPTSASQIWCDIFIDTRCVPFIGRSRGLYLLHITCFKICQQLHSCWMILFQLRQQIVKARIVTWKAIDTKASPRLQTKARNTKKEDVRMTKKDDLHTLTTRWPHLTCTPNTLHQMLNLEHNTWSPQQSRILMNMHFIRLMIHCHDTHVW